MKKEKRYDSPRVKWLDWKQENFDQAIDDDKPVLLYLTSNWGHTVQYFENNVLQDSDIVQIIEDQFVPIKVDVHHRPEIFSRYNRGGWPSICILTPTGELLLGRTAMNRSVLLSILEQTADYYRDHKEEILQKILEAGEPSLPLLRGRDVSGQIDDLPLGTILKDVDTFYDFRHDGFERAPKYPRIDLLKFLLESSEEKYVNLAIQSLSRMQDSALHDHIGGGFFRFCEDEAWRIPSFEKTLFDNAAFLSLYLEAGRLTGNEEFFKTVSGILNFMTEVLGDEEDGLFYAAFDSDSIPGDKTSYYGWSESELREKLDETVAEAIILHFGISDLAAIPGSKGECAPEKRITIEQTALRLGLEESLVHRIIDNGLHSLLEIRKARQEPGIDTNYLSSALGKTLAPLAAASIHTEKPRLLQRSFEIADMLWEKGRWDDGGLKHILDEDNSTIYLADFCEVILGLLGLYKVAGRGKDLERAVQIAESTVELLGDDEGPGCYDFVTAEEEFGALKIKYMPFIDNSLWLMVCVELGYLIEDEKWLSRAKHLVELLKPAAESFKLQNAVYMTALKRLVHKPLIIDIISGDNYGEMRKRLLRTVSPGVIVRTYDPDQKTRWTDPKKYPGENKNSQIVIYSVDGSSIVHDDLESINEVLH